jgi:hypothetical protein
MNLIVTNKIFYYYDASQNLLEETDAEETTLDEVLDEVFELEDDDISYVGFITTEGLKYKVKSDDYDSYKIYKFNDQKNNYEFVELGDWEKCKKDLKMLFRNS